MKRLSGVLVLVSTLSVPLLTAQAQQVRREIHFPDLPGYQMMTCDLHMHTVFSDGQVWPTVRVAEAWRQGIDAIAITDHIEYQPHKEDIAVNHNRPFDLAAGAAKQANLLMPRATEITRDTPPGHFNAVFLKDVTPLDVRDFLDAIKQANEQGAFVFWNHQGWKGSERGRWMDVHTTIYEKKWLHGMEVCNGDGYHPDAHRWCLEKGLTMLGTSDIHAPDLRQRSAPDDHRTMTLAFTKERSLEGLKEALTAGRTAVWYKDQIIGREKILKPLFRACVQVNSPHSVTSQATYLEIRNECDVDIQLDRVAGPGPQQLKLPARSTSLVKLSSGKSDQPAGLSYTATNFLIAPEKGLPVKLAVGD